MVLGKLGALLPIRNNFLFPLPFQEVAKIGRPWSGRPTGKLGVIRIARTTGEIDNGRYAQLFRQQSCLAADLRVRFAEFLVGMESVPMATEGADGDAVVIQLLLEFFNFGGRAQPEIG